MASFKTLVFVSLLIAAISVVPISEAQGATLSLSGSLLQSESFSLVFGTTATQVFGTTETQVFPNTLVMLRCQSGKLVAATTSNAAGEFSMLLDPVQFTSSVLNGCNITVNTTAPSGTVSALLQLVGSTLQVVNVTNFIATAFQFLPTLN